MISYFFSPHLASWKMSETTDIKVLKITVLFLVAIDDFIPPPEPGESGTLTAPALALKLFIRRNCLSLTSWLRPWQVFRWASVLGGQAGGEGVFPLEWILPSGPSFQLECLIQTGIVRGSVHLGTECTLPLHCWVGPWLESWAGRFQRTQGLIQGLGTNNCISHQQTCLKQTQNSIQFPSSFLTRGGGPTSTPHF